MSDYFQLLPVELQLLVADHLPDADKISLHRAYRHLVLTLTEEHPLTEILELNDELEYELYMSEQSHLLKETYFKLTRLSIDYGQEMPSEFAHLPVMDWSRYFTTFISSLTISHLYLDGILYPWRRGEYYLQEEPQHVEYITESSTSWSSYPRPLEVTRNRVGHCDFPMTFYYPNPVNRDDEYDDDEHWLYWEDEPLTMTLPAGFSREEFVRAYMRVGYGCDDCRLKDGVLTFYR